MAFHRLISILRRFSLLALQNVVILVISAIFVIFAVSLMAFHRLICISTSIFVAGLENFCNSCNFRNFCNFRCQARGEREVPDTRDGRGAAGTIVHAIPPPDTPSNHQPIRRLIEVARNGLSCFASRVQSDHRRR